MHRIPSCFRRWQQSLMLLLLVMMSMLVPAPAHTYPNYVFPPNTRTSHATSALTLSGDKLAILQPLPRRAISVQNGNFTFEVEMLRTCGGGGGSSSSSSSMQCTLFLDGTAAREVSLPCNQPASLSVTAAAAAAVTVVAKCDAAAPAQPAIVVSTQAMLLPPDASAVARAVRSCASSARLAHHIDLERHDCSPAFALALELQTLLRAVSENHNPRLVYPWLLSLRAAAAAGDVQAQNAAARSIAGLIRDWQFPLDADSWRTAAGAAFITDHALASAALLLQPYAHFVCSWTGAQMLARAGLRGDVEACLASARSSNEAAGELALESSCAHVLSWSPANHYALLALIASRLPISSVVVEIGTMHGAAAFALRAGLDEACRLKGFSALDCPSVVITYNVVDDAAHNAKDCGVSKDVWMQGVHGVEFVLGDLLRIAGGDEEEADAMMWRSHTTNTTAARLGWGGLCAASLIFVDTNHEGDVEDALVAWLPSRECSFRGLLVLDDVYVNEEMQRIWGHLPTNAKFDVSQHGHEFTGTGVVDFSRWPSDW